MTKREIASLVIKLMGVYILFQAIWFIPMSVQSLISAFQIGGFSGLALAGDTLFIAVLALVPFVLGLIITLKSDKISGWLIKKDKTIESMNAISKEDILILAFSCIGLYVIVTTVPALTGALFKQIIYFQQPDIGMANSSSNYVTLIPPVMKTVFGIWLFAGSKGIVKFWDKIRS